MATKKKEDIKEEVKEEVVETTVKQANNDKAMIEMLMAKLESMEKEMASQKAELEKQKEVSSKVGTRANTVIGKYESLRGKEILLQRELKGMGFVTYKDETGFMHSWDEEGAIEPIDGKELPRMKKNWLDSCTLRIVNDDEAVEVLGLKEVYELYDLFQDENKLKEIETSELIKKVSNMPKSFIDTLSISVTSNIQNGVIDSVRVINKLQLVLGKEFS